jgi:hypothetical protein
MISICFQNDWDMEVRLAKKMSDDTVYRYQRILQESALSWQ